MLFLEKNLLFDKIKYIFFNIKNVYTGVDIFYLHYFY